MSVDHRPMFQRVLTVLENRSVPVSRAHIATVLNANPSAVGTALKQLIVEGKVAATARPNAHAYLYALTAPRPAREGVRQWLARRDHEYAGQATVSLPLEPWADTVPQDAPQGAPWRPYRPASVAGGSVCTGGAKAASGPRLEGR